MALPRSAGEGVGWVPSDALLGRCLRIPYLALVKMLAIFLRSTKPFSSLAENSSSHSCKGAVCVTVCVTVSVTVCVTAHAAFELALLRGSAGGGGRA